MSKSFYYSEESVELSGVITAHRRTPETHQVDSLPAHGPKSRRLCGFSAFGKDKAQHQKTEQYRLENNLLLGVGFLEFANCGDFAANVWNKVPVPTYVIAFMIIGGAFSLIMTNVACRDARLCWRNICALRQERQRLKSQRQRLQLTRCHDFLAILDARLAVNLREIGTEAVNRLGIDISLGIGVFLVGFGSLLATGGTNHKIFRASNLLSGYIGNFPPALYSIVNAVWSVFVTRRARRHVRIATKFSEDEAVQLALRSRNQDLQLHATLGSVTVLISGAASLMTASMWYGYLVLIPCIISSIFCNYLWRCRLGYCRPLVFQELSLNHISIRDELKLTQKSRRVLALGDLESLRKSGYDPQSLPSLIKFLTEIGMFEDLYVDIITHSPPFLGVSGDSKGELTVEIWNLLIDPTLNPLALKLVQEFISERAMMYLAHKERFLLELLGCYLDLPQ